MKELVFLIVIVGLGVVTGLVTIAVRQFGIDRHGWQMAHEEVGGATEVYLVKGKNTHFCGRSVRSASNYTDKLFEIEEVAQEKMYEWNAADRVSRRLYK